MDRHDTLAEVLADPQLFSELVTRLPLRGYQLQVARAVLDSVLNRRGLTFAVMMSRQAGKNETSALLEALLLTLYGDAGGWIVKASPTFQPQTVNSLLRLEARLQSPWTRGRLSRERGHIIRLGQARAAFFSAQPGASVVGATASILLEADEAQDISEEKWNKDFRPMGAATNVTTVLWGTAWTPDTLLSRTVAALRRLEAADGRRRVFVVPWTDVAAVVPAYRAYVEGEIARLGPSHPIIRTQYALEDVDAISPMFPPQRQALMVGTHLPHLEPQDDATYTLTVDVAGQAVEGESDPADPLPGGAAGGPDGRDCTAVTLFAVEVGRSGAPLAGKARFNVVRRFWWRGLAQAELYERLVELADAWSPRRIVVDATGLGAGLASFLQQRFGHRVVSFVFTAATKSDLGWAFLALVDTGRFKDHALDGSLAQAEFRQQVAAAHCELLPGPGRRLRWGVRRGHDDLLVSAALCAVLDGEMWGATGESYIIPPPDIDDPEWCAEYERMDLDYCSEEERRWRRWARLGF
jgi:hypothetical protein